MTTHRRRTGLVVGLTLLVLVTLGFVVADVVAAQRTRETVSDAIVENVDEVVGVPAVDVGGFPFLPQLARGELDRLDATVDGATLGGIAMTDLVIGADGVSTSTPYRADEVVVHATIPTASLQGAVVERTSLELTVEVAGDALRLSGQVLGLDLAGELTPRVEDGRLLVDVATVSVGGVRVEAAALPSDLASRLHDLEIPVEDLPDGLVLTDAVVQSDGVRVTASGTDVAVPGAAP
ncbi:LmeA family phospholipid-binding protein [Cellulomonas gelida]|uniref:LmeA family phospholipid-binding protein n=1 Tax=Cellulomonas gelida TaxID=1712 RepID=UPI00114145FB|nr:DUF2993 domain-containing protein [Cellulomonas gelida]